MRRLVLDSIPSDFDPEHDVLLGPWTIVNSGILPIDYDEYKFFASPFEDIDFLAVEESRLSDYIVNNFFELAKTITGERILEHSVDYWRVRLLPYIFHSLSGLLERQSHILKFYNTYKNEAFQVQLLTDLNVWRFNDTNDFVLNGLNSVTFNYWLYSRIIENLPSNNWELTYITKENENKLMQHPQKPLLGNWNRVGSIYGINKFWRSILSAILHFQNPVVENFGKSEEKKHACDIDFVYNPHVFIQKTFPKYITVDIYDFTLKHFKKNKYNITSHQLWYDDYFTKPKLALAVEKGERLVSVQHGGHNYGSAKIFSLGNEIEFKNDKFITWGWTRQSNYSGNFVPLPSPLLSKYINTHKKKNNKIIFVGTHTTLFLNSIESRPFHRKSLKYLTSKINFLKHLSEQVLNRIYYRPAYVHNGIDDLSLIGHHFPNINILEKNFHRELLSCELLVLDHPGTTLNIAFAANVPTICFWDRNLFPFDDTANLLFDEMKKNSMFFESPKVAALFIDSVDYNELWYSDKIQRIRNEYVKHFAYSSKCWQFAWVKFLLKLCYS